MIRSVIRLPGGFYSTPHFQPNFLEPAQLPARVSKKSIRRTLLKMSFKARISLLVSLTVLTCAIAAVAQTPPSAAPAPEAPETYAQALAFTMSGESFLGVHTMDIDKEKAARYGLRDARGVGITQVVAGSPAEKAGLRKDDVIIRFDGESVTSSRKLQRLVSEVAPDHTVRVGIVRGGTEQEVTVTIGKREGSWGRMDGLMRTPRAEVWGPGVLNREPFVMFGNSRRIGVSTTQLTKQLAEYFGVADGQGVLVTSVSDDGPAAQAGIKAGDVITAVDGDKIAGAGDLTRALNRKKEGTVTLTIVRDKSQRTITVTPKAAANVFGPQGGTQVGRRVIVPRVEIPAIPEMNIQIPRIEIPAIPEIHVEFPPRVRRATSDRPI